MNSEVIKAIIIESDVKHAKLVQAAMPDYIDASFVKFSAAQETLDNGVDGAEVGLVIMDADDREGKALSIYKYMMEGANKRKLRKIPVIIFTVDEFSDKCMDFYDVGEPIFYTGELDDSDFFIALNDAIDSVEFMTDDDYEDDVDPMAELENQKKSPEKLMGMVFETKNEPVRAAAYKDERAVKAIISAVKDGKVKVKQIYDVLDKVAEERTAAGKPVGFTHGISKEKTVKRVEKTEQSQWKKEHAPSKNKEDNVSNLHRLDNVARVSQLLEGDDDIQSVNQNAVHGPYGQQPGVDQQGGVAPTARQDSIVKNTSVKRPKVVLIVDTDPNTVKAFKLFLASGYIVHMVDSSMKALDFVVKNRVDIVCVEYNVNGMPGLSIIKSIKNQRTGAKAKPFMLIKEKDYTHEMEGLFNTAGVLGIITKPIVKKQLLAEIKKAQ